jgi:AraC-like DNA-binding protein
VLRAPPAGGMLSRVDALSQALSAVHMTGAIFFDVECASPWAFAVPAVSEVAHLLAPGTGRIVNYHVVTDGRATVRVPGMGDLHARAGDVVVLPNDSPHTVSNGRASTIVESAIPVAEVLSGSPRAIRLGGRGDVTRIICGFFGCDKLAERSFLAGLPPAFSVNLRTDDAGQWLESSVRHLLGQAQARRPGTAALLSKMAQVLFVETLRRYMGRLPAHAVGWLAGARDPLVGGALAQLHGDPRRPWTLAMLARAVGASRSVLGQRFIAMLGEPPLGYLARWRLHLAARLLENTAKTALQIAIDVGYGSEPTFNRAFKREFGVPPARYRRSYRASAAPRP